MASREDRLRHVIVFGSRTWSDKTRLFDALDRVADINSTIVHGACPRGADAMADEWARETGCAVERHPADWEQYGKRAGFVRNEVMAKLWAPFALGFFDGPSPGSMHMLQCCIRYGISGRFVSTEQKDDPQ